MNAPTLPELFANEEQLRDARHTTANDKKHTAQVAAAASKAADDAAAAHETAKAQLIDGLNAPVDADPDPAPPAPPADPATP